MQRRAEIATLGGGCFWCLEAVFEQLEGVERVVSGYAGGTVPRPSYEDVCGGRTGHAEVVQVTFDPATISYRDLLEIFFAFHDPTTLNLQGADAGTQYRSAIFTADRTQDEVAREVIDRFTRERLFDAPIVTQVAALAEFFPAEDHHQGYYQQNTNQPYCRTTIAPKMAKLRAHYAARLKGKTPAR